MLDADLPGMADQRKFYRHFNQVIAPSASPKGNLSTSPCSLVPARPPSRLATPALPYATVAQSPSQLETTLRSYAQQETRLVIHELSTTLTHEASSMVTNAMAPLKEELRKAHAEIETLKSELALQSATTKSTLTIVKHQNTTLQAQKEKDLEIQRLLYLTMQSTGLPLPDDADTVPPPALNDVFPPRRTLPLWSRPMGRGKRTIARSLRLTDLWKGRRTSSLCLPLPADATDNVASLLQDSSSNNYSSSSSSTVGQPAFNVMQGSSEGSFPSSFPPALLENNNLRQYAPALALPDLSVRGSALSCHHYDPPAPSAPPPRPTPGSDTGLSTTSPTVTPTSRTTASAVTIGNPYQGVRSLFAGAQETISGIQPELPPRAPPHSEPSPYASLDNPDANHLPDSPPVRPVTRIHPMVHGTAGHIDSRPSQPLSVAPLTLLPCSAAPSTSPPRSRQGQRADSPPPWTPRVPTPPDPDPPSHLASPRPAPDPPHPVAASYSRKRPLTLHDDWCPDRLTSTPFGPQPPCRCPPTSPGGRRHHGASRDGDRPRKTSRAARPASPEHYRAPLGPSAPFSPTPPPRSPPASPEVQFLGPSGPLMLRVSGITALPFLAPPHSWNMPCPT